MEAVHVKNAERLNEIVNEYGWPDEHIVGKDAADAAWLIIQHAIGFSDLPRKCLSLVKRCADKGGHSSMARARTQYGK
jgi:hypothetical protein